MTNITLNLTTLSRCYDNIEDFWEDEIDDVFTELEEIIRELDLSDKTIRKLLGILQKDKDMLLYNLTRNVTEEEWETL